MTLLPAAKSALTLIGAIGFSATAFAQGLDELPPDVEAVAAEYVQQCKVAGGQPDFNPLDYVTLVFFGKDWSAGGAESYIVDTSALACVGASARPACEGGSCIVAVLNPRGKDRFVVDFEGPAASWRLLGPNAAERGPEVDIEITGGAGPQRYRITGRGMQPY